MSDNKERISIAEAKSTLEKLAKTEQKTNEIIKAPLWIIILVPCLYGLMTFSLSSAQHENLWGLGFIISTVTFLLVVAFYLYTRRLLGGQPRLSLKNKAEFIFHLSTGLIFGAIFALTIIFSKGDIWWMSYLGTTINTLLLAYIMYNAPSGHYFNRKLI